MIITRVNDRETLSIGEISYGDIFLYSEDDEFYLKTNEENEKGHVICYDLVAGNRLYLSKEDQVCTPIKEIKIVY